MRKPRVAIIGAGNVGIRYAYSLMLSGQARSIVVLDRDRRRAEGEVLDLASGMPYVSPVEITAGDYPDLAGSDLVVITAGKKQLPGQTRLDLARDNLGVYREIVPQIMRHAPDAILLVVTNPVDVLAYATYRISGKPWQQVIGSGTVLDTARFRFLLSQLCGVDARNIHAYILGEHGDTEFPVLSSAVIGGTMLDDHCPTCRRCDHREAFARIFSDVRDYAYRIIENKGETSYGIGLALTRITEAILNDENSVLPVSCLADGYQGIRDVYLSVPAVVNRGGVREILDVRLNDEEMASLKRSAASLIQVARSIGVE